MADQKRWFKVWTSIVSDDDFDPTIPGVLEGVGRFALLGAYTALHGNRGVVEIAHGTLFRLMKVENLVDLRSNCTLKNVHFEEGKSVYGKITVTWDKWVKYQEDSTQAERQKASRIKRRGEEKREEEIRREENTPAVTYSPSEYPAWLDPKTWEAFKTYRKKMKKPIVEESIIKKLAKYHDEGQDPNEILEQTIVNGWQGLFPVRQSRDETPEEQIARMHREGKL